MNTTILGSHDEFKPISSSKKKLRMSTRIAHTLLRYIMPCFLKRITLASSVAGMIYDAKHPRNELLLKLNKTLNYVSVEKNLLPLSDACLAYSGKIWTCTPAVLTKVDNQETVLSLCRVKDNKLTVSTKRRLVSACVNEMPDWLRYASNTKMKKDLMDVLNHAES